MIDSLYADPRFRAAVADLRGKAENYQIFKIAPCLDRLLQSVDEYEARLRREAKLWEWLDKCGAKQ